MTAELRLPTGWFGIQLPGRPCGSTYCLTALDRLPGLTEWHFTGGFEWLVDPGRTLDWSIGSSPDERAFDPGTLARVGAAADRDGFQLPVSFRRFLRSERRDFVRSATGCWLELAEHTVELSGLSVRLVRFLNDQQGTLFWYLAVGPDGDDGVVVSNDLLDATERWLEPEDTATTYLCAPSFETFIYRFWIENEIAFRVGDGEPLTPDQQRYVERLASSAPR